MEKMIPGIIIPNPEMLDENKEPSTEVKILPHALMCHPSMLDKLLEGMKNAFSKEDFKIMNSMEYRDFINENYPEQAK